MSRKEKGPSRILAVDIGGSKVKFLASGETQPRRMPSGPQLEPAQMVERIRAMTRDWKYDAVSVGYCGLVGGSGPHAEPQNLGSGWVGFDFAAAFGCPVRIVNDAAMQALGSYDGGRMLFLGLGTGLGSALIVEGILEPMELAHLPYKKGRSYEDYLGTRGMKATGKKKWRKHVADVTTRFKSALEADYVVIGGGNAKLLHELPAGARLGSNARAFAGGLRLWETPKERGSHGRRPARSKA